MVLEPLLTTVSSKENSMNKRWFQVACIIFGVSFIATPFILGFGLNYKVDPLFWLRFEFSKEFKKTLVLRGVDPKVAFVQFSFIHGNSGVFADAELFVGTNRVVHLGGNESTFVSLQDIDGDSVDEVLFTTASRHGSDRAVWKLSNGTWHIVPTNAASYQLVIAELLFYGPISLFVGVIFLLIGILKRRVGVGGNGERGDADAGE